MEVTLLASTRVNDAAFDHLTACSGPDADYLGEFAGRACYQSWDRPNPATAANADYLENVIDLGHESVLAHGGAAFYVTGVSRSLTHELIRSRFLAFSELSQRYVNAEDFRQVYPPAAGPAQRNRIDRTFALGIEAYAADVEDYLAEGLPRKEARQAARAHLPLCTETKIVVSGNLRAWRDFLRQRLSPHADAEIRLLAEELLRQLRELAPATFADAGTWSA